MTKNIVTTTALSIGIIFGIFQFSPSVYASFAYKFGLPITEDIKKANPGAFLSYQTKLLSQGERKMKGLRVRLDKQRRHLDVKIFDTQKEKAKVTKWLDKARSLYAENPNSNYLELAGKKYSKSTFGQQVILLERQRKALKQADKALQKALSNQQNTLMKLVEKETVLSSDRARLESAKVIWESQEILADMDFDIQIDLNFDNQVDVTDYLLRTATELSGDQETIDIPKEFGNSNQMSDEALAILNL